MMAEKKKAIDTERIARKGIAGHMKCVFLINFCECLGELHDQSISIRGDEMSVPYWVTARRLRGMIAPVQFWVYRAAIETLRARGV